MADKPIAVLIVDDQSMVRMGLRMIVENEPDMAVAGEAGDGEAACAMASALNPDVILMDIRMPIVDGIEATRRVRAGADPSSPEIIVLTTFDDEEYVLGALQAGAAGFLLKDAAPQELIDAIRCVSRGEGLIDPTVTKPLIARLVASQTAGPRPAPPELDTLSEREREILLAVAQGLSNRDIAEQFFLSEATVKSHVSAVLSKLGLANRAQVVVLAYETGLITPGENRSET